jgi:hypothetical protein
MLELEVLGKRPFGSIRLPAATRWTHIVSLDFVGASPDPLLFVLSILMFLLFEFCDVVSELFLLPQCDPQIAV